MLAALTETNVILMLFGIIQLVSFAVSAWALKTLIDLKVFIAVMQSQQKESIRDIHQLQEYRQWSESKLKQMWNWYKLEFLDSKPSTESQRKGNQQ